MMNHKATVNGIDIVQNLVDLSMSNTRMQHENLLLTKRISFRLADGWNGYKEGGPYDVIHVGAAAATFPELLLSQLKVI